MVAIETKTIEKCVAKGVSPEQFSKEHNIDVDTAKWLFEGVRKKTLRSEEQEFVLFS